MRHSEGEVISAENGFDGGIFGRIPSVLYLLYPIMVAAQLLNAPSGLELAQREKSGQIISQRCNGRITVNRDRM